MTLKESISLDIDDAFFDTEYFFSEDVNVEGSTIKAQLDSDYNRGGQSDGEYLITDSTILLFAKSADLPTRREAGDVLMVNGRDYTITAWREVNGVAEISLFLPE